MLGGQSLAAPGMSCGFLGGPQLPRGALCTAPITLVNTLEE